MVKVFSWFCGLWIIGTTYIRSLAQASDGLLCVSYTVPFCQALRDYLAAELYHLLPSNAFMLFRTQCKLILIFQICVEGISKQSHNLQMPEISRRRFTTHLIDIVANLATLSLDLMTFQTPLAIFLKKLTSDKSSNLLETLATFHRRELPVFTRFSF